MPSNLYKMLAFHLFELGYTVLLQSRHVVVHIPEHLGRSSLKLECRGDELGFWKIVDHPLDILINGKPEKALVWTKIGNIHDPSSIDTMLNLIDHELIEARRG